MIMIVSGLCTLGVLNLRLKQHSRDHAREKAMAMLDRNLAIHTFYSHQLKPALFETLKPVLKDDDFQPVWMSSTFAVREIDKYFHSIASTDYYYKECAINARSPENEADPFEREFIQKTNQSQDTKELVAVRTIDHKPYFVVIRRGEVMESSCLRCHSTPEKAPKDLVKTYGPDRSFNRFEGDIVSAISIRIPLVEAYENIDQVLIHVFIFFCLTLLAIFVFLVILSKKWIFDPLESLQSKALDICENPHRLGETIPLPQGFELSDVTRAFNAMSEQLRKERDLLEDRVTHRTRELNQINDALKKESIERTKVINDLQKALNEIKTLKGILPICSHCNKIRDDKGDWNRMENYISKHSDADFSHSVCPDCARRHYPGMNLYDE